MKIGRIAGIQIDIDYSWLIIFLLVLCSLGAGYFPAVYPGYTWWAYAAAGLLATLLFFASVLTHELAHAMVANRLGEEIKRITLFLFGGIARLSQEPTNPQNELKVAGIGPLTSLALGALFWGLAELSGELQGARLLTALLRYLGVINVALAVFNLLPGFPLDGGRLARALLWWRSGDLRAATERVSNWGAGIAVGLMVLGALEIFGGALAGGLWLILIGMFLRGAAHAGYQQLLLRRALDDIKVSDLMTPEPTVIEPQLSVGDAIEHYFLHYAQSEFPVASNGHAEGVITMEELRHVDPDKRSSVHVGDVMRGVEGVEVAPGDPISQALSAMAEADIGQLLVVQRDRLIGVLSHAKVVRFLQVRTKLEGPAISATAASG